MAFRILIADDHEIVRRGLCALLSSHDAWTVCAEAADTREAVRLARELMPDLVILDVVMLNLSGLAAARQICRKNPKQQVLAPVLRPEYFWLCTRCSALMTLRLGQDGQVIVVPLPANDSQRCSEPVAWFERQNGFVLRSLNF